MLLKDLTHEILREIGETTDKVSEESVEQLIESIKSAKRVFVAGTGRSLLVGKMFAMRLMQMGITVYVVGDEITPAIREGDLLIAITGSGRTQFTIYSIEASKKRNVKVACITAKADSPAAEMSDVVVVLPTKTKYDLSGGVVPLGTMFELSAAVFLDAVATILKNELGVTEEEMLERHNVLE